MAHFSIRWKLANLSYCKGGVRKPRTQRVTIQTGFSGLPGRQLFPTWWNPYSALEDRNPSWIAAVGACAPTPAAAKYMVHISRRPDAHIHSCTNQRRPQQTAFILISRSRPSTVVRLQRRRSTSEALFERWKNPHSKQTERTGNTLTHNRDRKIKKGRIREECA